MNLDLIERNAENILTVSQDLAKAQDLTETLVKEMVKQANLIVGQAKLLQDQAGFLVVFEKKIEVLELEVSALKTERKE